MKRILAFLFTAALLTLSLFAFRAAAQAGLFVALAIAALFSAAVFVQTRQKV